MYFVHVCENRTMKHIEIVIRKGGREIRENDGGG
jgi:hypothetical protein